MSQIARTDLSRFCQNSDTTLALRFSFCYTVLDKEKNSMRNNDE
jgi:hypothetical protein